MKTSSNARLYSYLVPGLLLGSAYVAFDVIAEKRLALGTLTGAFATLHNWVDHLLPVFAGGLFGLALYQLGLQRRLREAEKAAERAEALKIRLQKVERDQAVWVLIAAVLHEINNPLHALGLLLDELALEDVTPVERSELAQRARAQVQRALGQVGTLRSLRKVGQPELARLDLVSAVRALVNDLEHLGAEQHVQMEVTAEGACFARADSMYLRTILENLVDNSLHALHARAAGRISIRIYESDGRAVMTVTDDGPAIATDTEAVLFDPLGTSKGPHLGGGAGVGGLASKSTGLGLGLSIARALARAMDGDLVFEREPKCFRLTLPVGVTQ
ncbi:MAG TPA: HAMP domain-containing sensor histidine kinase [Polyangiaceae bacterium]|nr:HAMP domain-containing sensor histidine kinase [Polyangiaceae bacterium]